MTSTTSVLGGVIKWREDPALAQGLISSWAMSN